MKLRQIPEDFIVEEIPVIIPKKEKDKFKVYLLEKRGLEIFSIISYIAKVNDIPRDDIDVAGLKDKHSISKQYLTIPSKYELKVLEEKNFSLKFLGYSQENIKLGNLEGNHFEITVRDIKKGELEAIYNKAKDIETIGVPNYFDNQRFGSVMHNKFIIKEIIKGKYEEALKIILTEYTKKENKKVKDEKRKILENWKNLKITRSTNKTFDSIIQEYKKTGSYLEAYKKVPFYLRNMYTRAYQSYLWNECIKELIRTTVREKDWYKVSYSLGNLYFYKKINEARKEKIPETFETISPKSKPNQIMQNVLKREKIDLEELDIRNLTDTRFDLHQRKVLSYPKNFSISQPELDDINDKKGNIYKIKLSFDLQKGSYATIIIKRIFNQ